MKRNTKTNAAVTDLDLESLLVLFSKVVAAGPSKGMRFMSEADRMSNHQAELRWWEKMIENRRETGGGIRMESLFI